MGLKIAPRHQRIGWAKVHKEGEAQRLVSEFETRIVEAIIALGNEGVDPAFIGEYLVDVAAGVTSEGFGPLIDAITAHKEELETSIGREIQMPEVDPKIKSLGGHGPVEAAIRLASFMRDVLFGGRVKKPAFAGPGGAPIFIDTNGLQVLDPLRPSDPKEIN